MKHYPDVDSAMNAALAAVHCVKHVIEELGHERVALKELLLHEAAEQLGPLLTQGLEIAVTLGWIDQRMTRVGLVLAATPAGHAALHAARNQR